MNISVGRKSVPRPNPLHACVAFQRLRVEDFGSDQLVELLGGLDALVHGFDALHHDAVAVLLEHRVLDVILGGLSVREVDRGHFDEMLDLPQASVVLWDVLDDCHVW